MSLFSGPNSTLNRFIEGNKDDWDTGIEFPVGYLIKNATEMYNYIVA